jgi:hypothetical protein
MQGKALVVNPAVIHPSATPTIVVGRERGHSEKARKCRAFEIGKFEVFEVPEPESTTISYNTNQMVPFVLAGP